MKKLTVIPVYRRDVYLCIKCGESIGPDHNVWVMYNPAYDLVDTFCDKCKPDELNRAETREEVLVHTTLQWLRNIKLDNWTSFNHLAYAMRKYAARCMTETTNLDVQTWGALITMTAAAIAAEDEQESPNITHVLSLIAGIINQQPLKRK